MRAVLTGLHKATKRLTGGKVAVYAYSHRGGALIARAEGWSLAEANKGLEKALGKRETLEKIQAARKPMKVEESRAFVRGLIYAFKASPEFTKLAAKTKAEYTRHLAAFDHDFGPEKVTAVEYLTADILDWRDETFGDKPRTADYAVASVGRLFSWAKKRGLANRNPVEDVDRLHSADRSDIIWTDRDIVAVCAGATAEVALAVRLAAETGLRMGDLLGLTWAEIDGRAIVKRTSKRNRQAVIPLTDAALKVLSEIKKVSPVVLTNSRAKPWTVDGFKTQFRKAKTTAGITGLRFHDLRGTAATHLAMTGLTEADLALVFAWSPETVRALLTKYVSGNAVALDLLSRMKQKRPPTNRRQTGSVDKQKA